MGCRTAAKWMLSLGWLLALPASASEDAVFQQVLERAKQLAASP